MTEVEIREVVLKSLRRLAPEADFTKLSPDENVRQALDIDSYDFLMFLVALDEALGVEIPESDYGQLISLNDVIRYLATRLTATV